VTTPVASLIFRWTFISFTAVPDTKRRKNSYDDRWRMCSKMLGREMRGRYVRAHRRLLDIATGTKQQRRIDARRGLSACAYAVVIWSETFLRFPSTTYPRPNHCAPRRKWQGVYLQDGQRDSPTLEEDRTKPKHVTILPDQL
jgi:hypothetical protein